ncbi:hypothetical protein [Phascolarctobacterium faecium]
MISRVVLADLPCTIGGYCVTNADGEKICVLNAKHSFEGNKKTLLHEQEHVANNDFERYSGADEIEAQRHK